MARRLALSLALAAIAAAPAAAQGTLELEDNPVPDLVAILSFLTLDDSLTGASYRIENGNEFADDTEFSTIKLPWSDDFDVGSQAGTLYFEASVGYLRADEFLHVPIAGGEATIDQDWRLYAGKLGVGWTFPIAETWKLRPIVGGALSHIDNDADYNELGEEILRPLVEGTFVNWDGWAATGAASLALRNERELGEVDLNTEARYTYTRTSVFDATDDSQEGTDSSEFLSVQADAEGPTPWELSQRPIRWRLFGSYVTFLDAGDSEPDFDHVFQLGLGARFPLPKLFDNVLLSGSILFGPDIQGSTFGLSVGF